MYTNTAATRLNNGKRRNTLHCKRIGEARKQAKEIGKTVALEATSNKKLEPPERFCGGREGE